MKRKIDLENEKIKYVALGDSISAGYNSRYNFGYAGKMEANKNVIGLSWPSYFVRNLLKLNKSIVESYENFSISGTTPGDWCYFLGIENEKYNYEKSKLKIQFGNELSSDPINPERNRVKRQFKNFGVKDKKDFDYLKKKIKQANLITLNIGANYLIPKIPIKEIVSFIVDKQMDEQKIINDLTKIINSVREDVINLIEAIKLINDNAIIVLVGYQTMQGPFWNIIQDIFANMKIHNEIVAFCFDNLNNALRESAKQTKIDFISVNNKEFIKEHSFQIYNIFYDIHPTLYGYKKMAQDILAKLALPSTITNSFLKLEQYVPTFNEEYINQDFGSYSNRLDFSKLKIKPKDIITSIYGKENELLFKKSKIDEKEFFLETPSKYVEHLVGPSNDIDSLILLSMKNAMLIILKSSQNNNDLSNDLIKDIDSLFKSKLLVEFENQTNFGTKLTIDIQKDIDDFYEKYKRSIKNNEFINLILSRLLDFDFITNILKGFAKFWAQQRNRYGLKNKKIFVNIINELLTKDEIKDVIKYINKKIFNFIVKEKMKFNITNESLNIMFDFVDENLNHTELFQTILDFIIKNMEAISKINNFEDLHKLILGNETIVYEWNKTIKNMFKNLKVNNEIVIAFMNKMNIENNYTNVKNMTNFFEGLIIFFNKFEFGTSVLSKLLIRLILHQGNENYLQNIIEILLIFSKKEFWGKTKKIKLSLLPKQTLYSIIVGLDLIMSNLSLNNDLMNQIFSLTTPKTLIDEKTNKMKVLNLFVYIDKINQTKNALIDFFKMMIDSFYLSNFKVRENIYYKTYFRVLTLLLLISRQLFQKKYNKNIFMSNDYSIVKKMFNIAGYKNGKNGSMDSLILKMFNENDNPKLELQPSRKENRILLNIYYLEANNESFNTNENKEIIIKALRNGFVEKK